MQNRHLDHGSETKQWTSLGDWEDDHPTLEKEYSHGSKGTYFNAIVVMVLMMTEIHHLEFNNV